MGKIILNGITLTDEFDAPTLLELVVAVEEKEIPDEEIVTQVKVDGFSVMDFTHEDNTLVPYRSGSTVEIVSEKLVNIMKKSVDEFIKYLDRLLPGLNEIATMFREGREDEGHKMYLEAVDGIKVMIELVQNMSKNKQLDLNTFSHNGVGIQELFKDLSGAVEAMIQAQTNGDTKALADVLDNQAYAALKKWANVMPALKQKLSEIE